MWWCQAVILYWPTRHATADRREQPQWSKLFSILSIAYCLERKSLISNILYSFVATFKQYCNCPWKTVKCMLRWNLNVCCYSPCSSWAMKLKFTLANLSLRGCIRLFYDTACTASIIHIIIINLYLKLDQVNELFSAMAEQYGYLSAEVTVDKYVLSLEKTHFSIHTAQGMQSKCTNGNLLSTGIKQCVNLSVIDVIIIRLFYWEGIHEFCCTNILIIRVLFYWSPWCTHTASHLC